MIRNILEGQEFYNLMQNYRHSPISNPKQVHESFENVKRYMSDRVRELELTIVELEHRKIGLEQVVIFKDAIIKDLKSRLGEDK